MTDNTESNKEQENLAKLNHDERAEIEDQNNELDDKNEDSEGVPVEKIDVPESQESEPVLEESSSNSVLEKKVDENKPQLETIEDVTEANSKIESSQIKKDFNVTTQSEPAPNVVVKKSGTALSVLAILFSLAALGGSGFLFYKSQEYLNIFNDTTSKLQTENRSENTLLDDMLKKSESENLARLEAHAVKLVQLENLQSGTDEKTKQLTSLYHELVKTRHDWLLNEVEYTLNLTQTQLELTGNTSSAVSVLEAVQDRLQSINKPDLADLEKAIAQDVAALKEQPSLDTVKLSAQLEELANNVAMLPTAIDSLANSPITPVNAVAQNADSGIETSWWQRTWTGIKSGLGSLVEVKSLDSEQPVFFHPEQSYFVRENMRLQMSDARLALLQKQGAIYLADLNAVEIYAKRYFDQKSPEVQKVLQQITELKGVKFPETTPNLSSSFSALRIAQKAVEVSLPQPMPLPQVASEPQTTDSSAPTIPNQATESSTTNPDVGTRPENASATIAPPPQPTKPTIQSNQAGRQTL